jgi:hypothetical protein
MLFAGAQTNIEVKTVFIIRALYGISLLTKVTIAFTDNTITYTSRLAMLLTCLHVIVFPLFCHIYFVNLIWCIEDNVKECINIQAVRFLQLHFKSGTII